MYKQNEEGNVLCASSSYEKKYYLNPAFSNLPEQVQNELKIMCVLFTEDVGGILMLRFEENGSLQLVTTYEEDDYGFDEIGAELKIKQMRADKPELLKSLELYYSVKKEER